jgi:hypothetical protein
VRRSWDAYVLDDGNEECTRLWGTSKRKWEDNIKPLLMEIAYEVNGSGSGTFPLAWFDTFACSGVEHSNIATTV